MKRSINLTHITRRSEDRQAHTRLLTRFSLPVLLALLLVLFGGLSWSHGTPVAPVAQAAGTVDGWTPTNGSLNTARYAHTMTLLSSGKVLVAGGFDSNNNASSSAELYDPSSGIWSLTGSLNVGRANAIAVLLSNGKVLVAGGEDSGNTALSSAELYDPTSGTWSTTGSLNVAHGGIYGFGGPTATLLSSGKVLVAGGLDNNGNTISSAELYDPTSGTWSTTGSLNTVRYAHTMTLLSSGKVLVAGGLDSNSYASSSAELYDPSSGTWSLTGSLNTVRSFHTATLLQNGKVLIAGGVSSNGNISSSAELYDPTSGVWSLTGSLNTTRNLHTAILLPDSTVLVAGGQDIDGNTLSSAEFYGVTGSDSTAPTLHVPATITTNATDSNGATVTYTVTATDPDNAADDLTISCTPSSGSAFPIGTTTVHCTARDPVGNTSSGSFQVVVVGASGQLSSLNSLIDSFNLQEGWETSLDAKMQQALNAVNAGDTVSAHNDLIALKNEVSAQTGKKLTASQASQIQAAITQIQKVLGY